MSNVQEYNLPKNFSKELLKKSISLESIGINELGWKSENIFEVIDALSGNNYSILGGDVYKITENGFDSTFDNWYFNLDGKNWQEFVIESRKKAVDYLKNYIDINSSNKKNLIYVLVYSNNDISTKKKNI